MATTPYPNNAQQISLYAQHEAIVERLAQQRTVGLEELQGCHKNVLVRLASYHWGKCSTDARSMMLNHPHHFVKSCAVIGQADLDQAQAGDIADLTAEQLIMRRQDLDRRAAEMEADESVQAAILDQGSEANASMLSLNAELNSVTARMVQTGIANPKHYIWV